VFLFLALVADEGNAESSIYAMTDNNEVILIDAADNPTLTPIPVGSSGKIVVTQVLYSSLA